MKILTSINLANKVNNIELASQPSGFPRLDKRIILKDIAENTFLIIISFVALLVIPIYHQAIGSKIDAVNEIFYNPDMLLLTLPFMVHCWLTFLSNKDARWHSIISKIYTFLLFVTFGLYAVYKIALEQVGIFNQIGIVISIWGVIGATYIFCIITNLSFFRKQVVI